eukprot:scaffold317306_cov33-Tisochrysis_lutea.AAC.1
MVVLAWTADHSRLDCFDSILLLTSSQAASIRLVQLYQQAFSLNHGVKVQSGVQRSTNKTWGNQSNRSPVAAQNMVQGIQSLKKYLK